MLKNITSSLESFKSLTFKPGLNILIAHKKSSNLSDDKHTRNAVGKTSLIEIVHFLFGCEGKNTIFSRPPLKGHYFQAEFDLKGLDFKVQRRGNKIETIDLLQTPSNLKTPQKFKKDDGCRYLGNLLFNLPLHQENDAPSFRELFSYFVRQDSKKGFNNFKKYIEAQNTNSQRYCISYLLGLDYTLPKRLENLSKNVKNVATLTNEISKDVEGQTIGQMKSKLAIIEKKAAIFQREIAQFKVIEQYKELEQEAISLTEQINHLANNNISDKGLLKVLKDSLQTEEQPSLDIVKHLYEEADLVLPNKVTKRLEDVKRFHQTIIANRKFHLQAEIESIDRRLKDRERDLEKLDQRRSKIMGVLSSGGALENYSKLQQEIRNFETETEKLKQNISKLESLEQQKSNNAIDKQTIFQRLKADHLEQSEKIKEACLLFTEISKSIYENPALLSIEATAQGPEFDIKVDNINSRGIQKMQIFCFDLMLMILNHKQGRGPGFLIHDSHLFDGVDERQIKAALLIGKEKAEEYNFQYITTFNSDVFPSNPLLENCVLDTELTDETETGGIFGVKF